ncbi:protein-tyrosine kinase 2-beta-like isoform X3 [Bolinopsis microptera]|uniref:protein-tyrosine kinase 2-beta-like isoform X3 n=1 Tax=Bolinopsis microptera TaxID=2820187 RepID=UPI00307A6440
MGSYLKVNLLTKETRTIKAHDGTTMQKILEIVIGRLRAINKQYFALQITDTLPDGSKIAHWIPNNYTLPDTNQRYPPADKDRPWEWNLKIRFLPNNIQNLAESDNVTFTYFYQQVRLEYFELLAEQMDIDTAVQLGCLEMRRQFKDLSHEALNKKSNINMLENEIGFDKFIPRCILDRARSREIKKLIQTNLKQFSVLTENQCVYKFFEILSKVKHIGIMPFYVKMGDLEDAQSIEVHVGPLHGISYKLGDTQVRIDFDSIQAITVEPTCTYQTRVILMYFITGVIQEERLDLFAPSVYTALELASLVDGYCVINTANKTTRITPDSEGAPRSLRTKGIHPRTHSMYSTNRHSFNGPGSLGLGIPNDLQRRSCFEMSGYDNSDMGPTFVEEEPDYAQAENDDWFLPPEDLKIFDAIGEGQFGTVFKGHLNMPDCAVHTEVAVKTLKEESSVTDRDKFLAEAFTMKKFDHPHIITLLGVVQEDRKPPWIVMELAEHGELRGYLHRRGSVLTINTLLMFTEQVCNALDYLECEHKVVHRDVAARNVLVFSDVVVKLADFGLSRHIEEEGYYKASKGRLPIKWMAPESINFRRFTNASDVWMFGVCIWELFMLGVKPFRGIKNSEVISMIESGHRLELPAKMPGPLYQLVYKCWSYEPSDRPTFKNMTTSIRQLMESYSDGGSGAGNALLPPTKPPRPPHFPTSSSRDSFRSTGATTVSTISDNVRQEDLARNLEEQRAQSRADGLWLRKQESESRHSFIPPQEPIPQLGSAPSNVSVVKKRIALPLNIDRTHDEVYKGLTALVQKIMDINQILEKVRAEDFSGLIGQVGTNLRKLLQATDTECSRISEQGSIDRSQVDMAQKVMIADMKDVIESMHDAKQLSSTTRDQQYRQRLLLKVTTLAKDGKSLLQAVDYCRSQSMLYSPNIDRSASVGDSPIFKSITREERHSELDPPSESAAQPSESDQQRGT